MSHSAFDHGGLVSKSIALVGQDLAFDKTGEMYTDAHLDMSEKG